ncbi:methylated-DNA--[protein]-cysteine S-methyltransferase [Virgibacillus halodenitrificans]|uniref:methylated-DNA--[protein]-cysteine S-methyltransferase n=1 Tax=Virgibacillus halodenitrificans TaxID=1482 RepID=UPI0024BF4DB7|nr:methylated-DNA--[protein]-cysteine S-methyltransferase [Virgibacillus halodenitrificans]WHX28019.1 methylated-DNA--[protein]-cysteine S-methyltransferase [Virgibacillus halodenitrificans]
MKRIYWSNRTYESWTLYLAATENGLCYVGFNVQGLMDWVKAKLPAYQIEQRDEEIQPYTKELEEYLKGERASFTFASDMHGTKFQLAVWREIRNIPYGQTKTYSEIANQLKKPTAIRATAAAIGANPLLFVVPCHRVIGKNGQLTGYRGGLERKRQLVLMESQQD